MPELSWVAEIVFFGSYFVAWCVHAFDPLTNVSAAAHTFILLTAIASLVIAVLLLGFHGYRYSRRPAGQA